MPASDRRPRGRPQIGRGTRAHQDQTWVRLGPGQSEDVERLAERFGCSGNQAIRRAINRLIGGLIPVPTTPADIPPALPAAQGRSVVLEDDHIVVLVAMGKRVGDHALLGEQTRPRGRGRPPDADVQRRDALIRYAIAADARDIARDTREGQDDS